MRVLITGASGFAGSHLVEALKQSSNAKDLEIFGTVFNGSGILTEMVPKDHIIPINLMDVEAVKSLFTTVKPDQIYHLASFAFVGQSFERGAEVLTNNIGLQERVLEAVLKYAPSARLLIIGSAEEYGLSEQGESPIKENHPFRPVNPYSVSKVAQDLLAYAYAVSHKLNIVRVRPFNHIGERQTTDFAIPAFAKQIVAIERGQQDSLSVGNLTGLRDFTDVKDMMRAYIVLMEKGQVGEVYNVGSGVGVKMSEIVDKLIAMSSAKIVVKQDERRFRPLDIPEIIADASKMKALGWKATIPLDETLKRVLEYWRKQ